MWNDDIRDAAFVPAERLTGGLQISLASGVYTDAGTPLKTTLADLGDYIDTGGPFLPLNGGGAVVNSITSFSRTDAILNSTPVVAINYTGKGSSNGALLISATNTDASGFMWGLSTEMFLTETGTGQPVGVASTIFRTSGKSPGFCFFGQVVDRTGLSTSPAVNTELDLGVCGPEGPQSYYFPSNGGKCSLFLALRSPNFLITWAANTAFASSVGINPPGQPLYTYVTLNAGMSGATQPTWPVPTAVVPSWTATTTVATGAAIHPTSGTKYTFIATAGGTTGGTEPVWPTFTGGTTVVDGTVTWTLSPAVPAITQIWTTATAFSTGSLISPSSSPVISYLAQTGGISGATEPVWPQTPGATVVDGTITWTTATVVDGSITWAFGTIHKPQISRAIQFSGSSTGGNAAQLGTGLYFDDLSVYNALLDGCRDVTMAVDNTGALINPNVAAIRIQQNWPIDFSGVTSPTGQNLHTIMYNAVSNCFEYQAFGTILLSIHDNSGSTGIGGGGAAVGFQLDVLGTNTVGITTSHGTFTTGLRLGSEQKLSLTSSDSAYFKHTATGVARTLYMAGGAESFALTDAGDTITGLQAAQLPASTHGGLYIPFCTSDPTGIPANATLGISIRYNTTNNKLWSYNNASSAWMSVTFS